MESKNIFQQLNIFSQCRRYGLSIWQCPSFLFFLMGGVIIVSSIFTYAFGTRYIEEPEIVALIVLVLTTILFTIAFIITGSFERLAEASRMKSEFISVVSHQLRTPLSNLKWAIDFLLSGRLGPTGEKQLEYFRILKENSGRMGELVSDLLMVSRIETANLPLNKKEFSLEDLTKELVLRFVPFAEASNVEIKFKFSDNLPKAFADHSQIRQALENLLDNAVRYVKEKGSVEVSLEKRNSILYLEIKDTGVGIPQQDQKYIFQKFFRSENVLRHQTQGSGLGLYIAKSIIEKSGGKIGFKSQEGQGSTFWIALPVK